MHYDYFNYNCIIICILHTFFFSDLKFSEHKDARWVTKETLHSVNWLPADQLILDKIEEIL